MRKLLWVVAALLVGCSLVVAADSPQVSIYDPPEEIDGTNPFYVQHGFIFISDEDLKTAGYRGPRDAAQGEGIGFELLVDGAEIEPTCCRPVRSKGVNPTTGEEFSGWAYEWLFRFKPRTLTEGLHESTGHWFWPDFGFEMWRTAEIPVVY